MRRRWDKKLTENNEKGFTLILGQCTEYTRLQLKGLKEWQMMKTSSDMLKLMQAIKGLMHQFGEQMYHPHALHHAYQRFYGLKQDHGMTNAMLLEKVKVAAAVVEEHGGTIGEGPGLIKTDLAAVLKEAGVAAEDATAEHKKDATAVAKQKCMAVALLASMESSKSNKLLADLRNDFMKYRDNYAKMITKAFAMLTNYDVGSKAPRLVNDLEGVAFANVEGGDEANEQEHPGGYGAFNIGKVRCYFCGKFGNMKRDCPDHPRNGGAGRKGAGRTANAVVEDEDEELQGTMNALVIEEGNNKSYNDVEEFMFFNVAEDEEFFNATDHEPKEAEYLNVLEEDSEEDLHMGMEEGEITLCSAWRGAM